VRYYDPASQAWYDDGIAAVRVSDTAPKTVSFETPHFTTFAVTLPGTPVTPKQCGCAGGGAPSGTRGDLLVVCAMAAALAWRARHHGKAPRGA
jgi:hypothetical protein